MSHRATHKNWRTNIWDILFKNSPSKYFFRLSSTNFSWSILEYFVPFERMQTLEISWTQSKKLFPFSQIESLVYYLFHRYKILTFIKLTNCMTLQYEISRILVLHVKYSKIIFLHGQSCICYTDVLRTQPNICGGTLCEKGLNFFFFFFGGGGGFSR